MDQKDWLTTFSRRNWPHLGPTDDKTTEDGDASAKDQGSEKKSGRWTGKNAWKLGLVFLSGWSVVSGGMLIYIWGEEA